MKTLGAVRVPKLAIAGMNRSAARTPNHRPKSRVGIHARMPIPRLDSTVRPSLPKPTVVTGLHI
jgi:hypothetical protein